MMGTDANTAALLKPGTQYVINFQFVKAGLGINCLKKLRIWISSITFAVR
jgi:hypothetical protein